jgi:putative FmdB family regulatory protein
MPTYDYQCDACDHRFEEFQYFSEEKLITCPQCHKDTLRRLFGTGAAVIFKGSGFYETDYRSDSYKAAAKAETEGKKGTSPGTTGTEAAKGTSTKTSEPGGTTGTNGTGSSSAGPSSPKNDANSSKSGS